MSSKANKKTKQSARPTAAQRLAQSERDKRMLRGNAPPAPDNRGITQAPAAISQTMGSRRAQITSQKGSDLRVRVRHQEFLQDIAGSVAYAVSSYSINPGLAATFPWLSQMAALFESYKFNSLKFLFKTEKGTSTTGKVLYSVDWDAADAAPASKQAQLQMRTKSDCAAWGVMSLPCDLQDLLKFGTQRYIRTAAQPAGTDIKTYDVGNFLVGTQGMADTTAVGELYIEYDVELITPQESPNTALSANAEKIVSGGTVSKTAQFGTAAVLTGGATAQASGNTLTFNTAGQYLVVNQIIGTVIGGSSPTLSGTASSSILTGSAGAAYVGAGGTIGEQTILVTVSSVGQTLVVDWSAVVTTLTSSVTRIAQYNASLA